MTKKIFRSMVVTAGAVLLASLVIIMGCLYEYFCGVQEQQLKDELSLAAAAVEQGGADYLTSLQSDRYRLTWVSADGTVLYDTQADAAAMENHAQRQEIRQALLAGQGESSRYSATLLEKTLYCARRLDDGTVLRISISRATAGVLVLGMLQPFLVVLVVALVLSALLARRLARHIVEPLNQLDLEHPMDNDTYEQIALGSELIGDALKFVKENEMCKVCSHNGNVFSIEPPLFVELQVTDTEPGFKGNTATGATKPAIVETGAQVNVPLFVENGEVIKIDTRTGEYLSRV